MTKQYKFELPRALERYLAALSTLYGQEGERQLQQIIVNAHIRVHEEWSHDNWNGGTYGHALYLAVPEALYLAIARQRTQIEERIQEDLNKIHNVQNEFIERIFIELELPEDSDWRQRSGALLQATRIVSEDAVKRIWLDNQFRLFLSHKTEVKQETAELKEKLSRYGVSCFVAHADIHPTKEWQDEIENALATMDGFAALMTEQFHESYWTDQEVGYAFARGVPIVAARLGRDPYGFIGKFQGLSCTWDSAPELIVKLFIKQDRMFAAYVAALRDSRRFDNSNLLANILPAIDKLSDDQIDALVDSYNTNPEVRGSFAFNGAKPSSYGAGILEHLKRWTTRAYFIDRDGELLWF